MQGAKGREEKEEMERGAEVRGGKGKGVEGPPCVYLIFFLRIAYAAMIWIIKYSSIYGRCSGKRVVITLVPVNSDCSLQSLFQYV